LCTVIHSLRYVFQATENITKRLTTNDTQSTLVSSLRLSFFLRHCQCCNRCSSDSSFLWCGVIITNAKLGGYPPVRNHRLPSLHTVTWRSDWKRGLDW
jgi:hypothetical protein